MQAIQFFHYKCLQEYLDKLQQEDLFNLPCEHANSIAQHEERLKEIYSDYQLALEQISTIIMQFGEHKQSIRRLIRHHKSCKKSLNEKNTFINRSHLS